MVLCVRETPPQHTHGNQVQEPERSYTAVYTTVVRYGEKTDALKKENQILKKTFKNIR